MATDDVVRRTELAQELPTGRGDAAPYEENRLRLDVEVEVTVDKRGPHGRARLSASAQDDGPFGRHLGLTVLVLLGAAGPGIVVAIILAIAAARGWLVFTGGIATMVVLAVVLIKLKKK